MPGFVRTIRCNCGSPMRLVHTEIGAFYGCIRYPDCDTKVTAHKKSLEPMGTPAGPRLRVLRRECHSKFDRVWRGHGKHMTRGKAYKYLSALMNREDAHIGEFTEEDCIVFLKRHKGVMLRAKRKGLQTFAEADSVVEIATRLYKEE